VEIVMAVLGILLASAGVYYARAQLLDQRRSRHDSSGEPATPVIVKESAVLDNIIAKKMLRVGCLWYPPFVEYTTDHELVEASGYYPDILRIIAEKHDLGIQFLVLKWHEAIGALEHGEVDVVACVLKSAERRARCDFAGTIFRVGVGAVVQSAQTKIRSHGDLARNDVSIAVTKGEIGWTYAAENLGLVGSPSRFTVLEDKNIQTMMSLVEAGKVDCALADSLSCSQFLVDSRGGAKVLSDVFSSAPLHVEDNSLMIAAGQKALAEWLETGITEFRAQPEFVRREAEIESRYQGILHRGWAT
jgi:ABC-type amino acid transport substrate-binding protein